MNAYALQMNMALVHLIGPILRRNTASWKLNFAFQQPHACLGPQVPVITANYGFRR